jgi:glycosyltransferase involved in cell wall biosynthesis
LLVEAFKMARDVLPGIALLLVGGGNAYERLRSKVGEMGLTSAVRFTGRIPPDQVPLYYRIADVSVDPVMDNDAARGRQPLKLFESWVSGVPFITGEVGDRKLLSGDPPEIYLCQPSDARALAEAIVRVLCDEGLRDRLRSQGLIRIDQYAWPVLARKLAVDLSLEV